jgi:hypothetical protein
VLASDWSGWMNPAQSIGSTELDRSIECQGTIVRGMS